MQTKDSVWNGDTRQIQLFQETAMPCRYWMTFNTWRSVNRHPAYCTEWWWWWWWCLFFCLFAVVEWRIKLNIALFHTYFIGVRQSYAAIPVFPVHLSVCPVRAPNTETKRGRKKNKFGVNVSPGRSNRCANFQFKKLKKLKQEHWIRTSATAGVVCRR